MSEQTMTPESGSGEMSVNEAASQFLSMMDEPEDSQEQPEAEQEEVELEAESEESDEDYEEPEESDYEPEELPRYRVKAAGEEKEVTLDELIKGYQLGADYTKKTSDVAEQRRAVEAERQAIEEAKQLREAYAQRLQLVEQFLSTPEEDIEQLKETDPIGYAVKVAEQTQKEKQLQAVRAEQAKLAEKQQLEQAQSLRNHLAAESEKIAAIIPEYSDKEKGAKVRQEIRDYAKSIGWTDQELGSVYDSRAVLSLYEGMQYRKLMQNKPNVTKKVAEAPKMVKPGTTKSQASEREQIKREKARLRETGRVQDAASIFERFL
jgi:hypothetical protein